MSLQRAEVVTQDNIKVPIKGKINETRRQILTRHHTATHVMLGAAKRALGSWIWQSSAFKDVSSGNIHRAIIEL